MTYSYETLVRASLAAALADRSTLAQEAARLGTEWERVASIHYGSGPLVSSTEWQTWRPLLYRQHPQRLARRVRDTWAEMMRRGDDVRAARKALAGCLGFFQRQLVTFLCAPKVPYWPPKTDWLSVQAGLWWLEHQHD